MANTTKGEWTGDYYSDPRNKDVIIIRPTDQIRMSRRLFFDGRATAMLFTYELLNQTFDNNLDEHEK